MAKSGPSNSGESTGSSMTPKNNNNNKSEDNNNGGGARVGSGSGFSCHICNKAFATKRALSGHKNAHRVIPVTRFCCLHGRHCRLVADDHQGNHDEGHEKPSLVTHDLLREWLPIYAVRQRAQAVEKPSEGAERGPATKAAEEEEEDGLDLELKL